MIARLQICRSVSDHLIYRTPTYNLFTGSMMIARPYILLIGHRPIILDDRSPAASGPKFSVTGTIYYNVYWDESESSDRTVLVSFWYGWWYHSLVILVSGLGNLIFPTVVGGIIVVSLWYNNVVLFSYSQTGATAPSGCDVTKDTRILCGPYHWSYAVSSDWLLHKGYELRGSVSSAQWVVYMDT